MFESSLDHTDTPHLDKLLCQSKEPSQEQLSTVKRDSGHVQIASQTVD